LIVTVRVEGVGARKLEQGTGVIYRKWIRLSEKPGPGDLVRLETPNGFEACGLWEPTGPVAIRVVSLDGCPYSTSSEAVVDRIRAALRLREKAGLRVPGGGYRLVNSDGDLLSGLIVDVFADTLAVVQSSSIAIDALMHVIADAIHELVGAENIYEKSTQRSRKDLGLPARRRWIRGGRGRVVIDEGGVKFLVDVEVGQKTGFYFDQRPNRLELERLVGRDDTVADVFSYTGGFGLHAAHAGARKIVFVEEDPAAISILKENLKLNHVENYEIVNDTVWNVMREGRLKGNAYDIVVVDPPAFIQSGDEEAVRRGVRAYTSVYKWGFQLARKPGLLYLSSCSYFLTRPMFLRVVGRAARLAGARMHRIMGSLRGAGRDHTLGVAEYLDYLKGAFVWVEG